MLIVVMMGKWSDDSACCVIHDVRLYSVLETVVVNCFVVRGCPGSRRYINVCNCDILVLLMCTLTIGSYVLCVLMFEGMSVVLNVMLSLMSVIRSPPALCNLSARTVVMYFWCVCFRDELGFLNCDDICMCVVNKQFEFLEFVFNSVYVDLQ